MSLDLDLNYPENNFKVGKSSNNKVYQFEEFVLDATHLMLSRDGSEIPLVPKAVETLLVLVQQRGNILSKSELMEAIWADSIVEESNLAQYLHILRKTLGKQQNGEPFIETLRRRGYRFNGDVKVLTGVNGSSAFRDARAELPNANSGETLTSRPSNRPGVSRTERHGNVVALADWTVNKPISIAEVVESPAVVPDKGRPRSLTAAAAALVLLAVGLSAWWIVNYRNSTAANEEDISITNLTEGEEVNFAAISPDGLSFVYSSHDGEKSHLWRQQTGQVSRIEIIEPIAGKIWGTSFTPDSQFVYFLAGEPDTSAISLYSVPALGGPRVKILSNVITSPSFSRETDEMAFVRSNYPEKTSSIMMASRDGTRERVLLTQPGKDAKQVLAGSPALSPNGRTVAFSLTDLSEPWRTRCTFFAMDVQTGATNPLSPERWDNCFALTWTTDGTGLIFVGTAPNEAYSTRRDQIYYLDASSGKARRLTSGGKRFDYASLAVTERDEVIGVQFDRQSQIWSMNADGRSSSAHQVTKGMADGRAGLASMPQGRVAYVTRQGEGLSIWTMASDGSDRKQLISTPPNMEEVRAARDGSFLVFSAKTDGWNHLYRVDADGSNVRQLTVARSNVVDSSISPDGSQIVFSSEFFDGQYGRSSIWRMASDGSGPHRLSDIECHTPRYSPDGEYISCVSPNWTKILVISAKDGRLERTFEARRSAVLNIGVHWTPDGNALAYIDSSNRVGNIFLQPLSGEPPDPLTDFTSGEIYNFDFSADGKTLHLARGYATRNAVLIKNFR